MVNTPNIYYKGLECYVYPPSVFWEVLHRFQLWQRLKLPLETVLDIGVHQGSLSLLAARFGAKKIIGIDPYYRDDFLENVKLGGFEAVTEFIEGAVFRGTGSVEIRTDSAMGMSSALYRPERDTRHAVEAPIYHIEDLIERFDGVIDYLKIDVEGGEWNFLGPSEKLKKLLQKKVRYIDLDIHPIGDQFISEDDPNIDPYFLEGEKAPYYVLKDLMASYGFESLPDRTFRGVNKCFVGTEKP